MAGKGAPPPYYQGAPPTNVVYVQQPPTVVAAPKPTTTHGVLGFMERELNAAGRMIDRELGLTAAQNAQAAVLNNFATNNVVQLVSRASGKTLQIVQSQTGHLVVDGAGPPPEMRAPNTLWTVINEGGNKVRLHNNNNYLTIHNGVTTVVYMAPGAQHGVETKLQLVVLGNFVLLQSSKEIGRHVGILENGSLKPALATGRENHAHFGVSLVSSPYPTAGAIRK